MGQATNALSVRQVEPLDATTTVLRTDQGPRGGVELFELESHAQAARCHGWSHATDEGRERGVAVIHAPRDDLPQAAVRAASAAEYRGRT